MTDEEYKEAKKEGKDIRDRAKENGLTDIDRWRDGVDHHPKSQELMESLMYEMDVYFEQKDIDDK